MVLSLRCSQRIVKQLPFLKLTASFLGLNNSFKRDYSLIHYTNNNNIRNLNVQKNTFKRFYSSNLPDTKFADLETARIEFLLELQNTFKNQSMSPKIKSKRLKIILLQLISVLPNNEFTNNQLPFVNSVINSIDFSNSPLENLEPDEMIILLKSVLGGMTLQDVKYIDFFPRFYNSLRECNEYGQNSELRLQLFEIFINYVLLSTKRSNVNKIINAFLKEENEIYNSKPDLQIVEILIDAFKSIKPDTNTILSLFKICPDLLNINKELSDSTILDQLLSNFFKASDEEISESFEDNFVSERLIELLDILESKIKNPFKSYVEILYFSVNNNFDNVSNHILNKLEKLTDNFKLDEYKEFINSDILNALVIASLKFNKFENANNLINLLNLRNESDYIEDDWLSLLQFESFKIGENKPAIELINEFNNKLSLLNKDFEFGDIESFNLILESLCWSNKSLKYIQEFKLDFENQFNILIDCKSVAIILEYLIKDGKNFINIKKASKFFLEYKDLVDWENDYEGFYMITLFKLTSNVWKCKEISWDEKLEVYKNVKRYEYLFDKQSIYEMIKSAIEFNEGIYAIKILLDQIPELNKIKNDKTNKNELNKLKVSKYQKIFDCIYNYLINENNDNELNEKVYKYLSDYFIIPYDYYPGFVKMFIDSDKPEMALKVFADMKKLSKESKLPPPNENFYIYLFKSFSKFQDEDSIFKLHLAIKMDLSINLDIKLLNSLMESYSSLEDPFKTRDIFNLAYSLPKEYGLNNESAYWMLKSLKYASLNHTKDFYNNLSTYDLIPDKYLFSEYLIANCYNEQFLTAFEILKRTTENGDLHLIDEYTIKSLYNNCLHDGIRNKLTVYCQDKFPKQWDNLLKSGELQINKTEYPDLLASPYDDATIEVKQISDV